MSADIQQRVFNCLNCQSQMRLDPSIRKQEILEKKKNDAESQEGLDGQSRNLMRLICDVDVPSNAPMCRDCSDELMRGMDSQLKGLEEECLAYRNLINDLQTSHAGTDVAAQRQVLRNLQDEERSLEAELERLTVEERRLDDHYVNEKKKLEEVSEKETHLWRVFRDNHRRLLDISDATYRVDDELRYAERQHNRLVGMSILDLCFHIWVDNQDGTIGEINGFRLGRLPDRPVDWAELNAAWGQLVLLLDVMMQRVNVPQDDHQLVVMGSHSSINVKRLSNQQTRNVPLYGSGSLRPFGNNNIDGGVVAFLHCFEQLCNALKAQDSGFKLQYRMVNKDRLIQGNMEYSAKMLLNSEERWTKAMKLLLANLRTALVQVVAVRHAT